MANPNGKKDRKQGKKKIKKKKKVKFGKYEPRKNKL